MNELDPNSTLAELVLERPSRMGPLDLLGVDYCCAGDQPLAVACREKGLDTKVVAGMLISGDLPPDEGAIDLRSQSVRGLCSLLEQRWHGRLLELLDTLRAGLAQASRGDRPNEPRRDRIEAVFALLDGELRAQLTLERRRLIPLVRAMESGTSLGAWLAEDFDAVCRELSQRQAGVARALRALRGLANGFVAPSWAPSELQRFYDGLGELSAATRLHAHARNNALIPQARHLLPREGGNGSEGGSHGTAK